MKKSIKEIQTTQEITNSKKYKYNYKLSDEDKQLITLDYYLNRSNQNIADLCNRYNISKRTLYNIINNNKNQKEVNKYITDCRNNFTKKTTILIDKAIEKLNGKIDEDNATIKDLVTAIGVLYDKNRLENNLSTNNSSININLKIEK